MASVVVKGRVIENSPAVLLRRVTGANGTNLTQADVSSLTVKVWDCDDAAQVGSTLTPSVASAVFDALQTDARWVVDSTGYNLALTIPGTYFPSAGTYNVECKVTPVAGDPFYLVWQVTAANIYSE